MENKEVELLRKELAVLRYEQKDKELNPHKYFDYYPWQHEFIYQEDHIRKYGCFPTRLYLTAANQVGKSFTLMGFGHRLCTDVEFRKWRWGDNQPRVIWYVLPTQDHINDFFSEKWEPEVLSRGEAKEKGEYAWKVIKKGRDIRGIHFLNTNCKLMFITLAAKSSSMQGRSVGAIIFDEEPPVEKLGELETRTASFNDPITGESNAILAFAFTPTTAQEYFKKVFCYQDEEFLRRIPNDIRRKFFWDKQLQEYRTCTPQQEEEELFKVSKRVYKRRVSIFEAQEFMSGKPGRYTAARAREFIQSQPSYRDIMVRTFAAFEKEDDGGRIYKYFKKEHHIKFLPSFPIEFIRKKGIYTAGLDYGSGSNHPGGVVITHIDLERNYVRVIKMWRGEKGKVTTAGDIVDKYLEISAGMTIDFPFYDHSCADLNTYHHRVTGKELLPAAKDKEGYGFVDALLKNNLLQIFSYSNEPYGDWITREFENINHNTAKKDREDELTDCVRYSLFGVAHLIDLEDLKPVEPEEMNIVEEKPIVDPLDYGVRDLALVPGYEDNDDDFNENQDVEDWGREFDGF